MAAKTRKKIAFISAYSSGLYPSFGIVYSENVLSSLLPKFMERILDSIFF